MLKYVHLRNRPITISGSNLMHTFLLVFLKIMMYRNRRSAHHTNLISRLYWRFKTKKLMKFVGMKKHTIITTKYFLSTVTYKNP